MRILLTGASGFIGRRLLEALHCRGYAVVASSRTGLLPVLRTESVGLFPPQSSYELLARVGVPGALAPARLYAAAVMDLAIGIATWLLKRRRFVWLAQAAVIIVYTAIISVSMPEFWLHPFGPLLKNLPMLAAILVLYQLERR
jgi:nucleoside-diphosphate-sugar epimerase